MEKGQIMLCRESKELFTRIKRISVGFAQAVKGIWMGRGYHKSLRYLSSLKRAKAIERVCTGFG